MSKDKKPDDSDDDKRKAREERFTWQEGDFTYTPPKKKKKAAGGEEPEAEVKSEKADAVQLADKHYVFAGSTLLGGPFDTRLEAAEFLRKLGG